uniref:SUEL-type lectin domain-containing protein n=1 Tax=Denticeps clupeoides TaxID=299321 RepID=A0AAY4BRX1_9TELE
MPLFIFLCVIIIMIIIIAVVVVTVSFNCPITGTEAIRIVTANYGRTDAVTCSDGRPLGQITPVHGPADRACSFLRRCRGKSSCAVQSSNAAFGDPCFGTYKYLNVTYSCVQSRTWKRLQISICRRSRVK